MAELEQLATQQPIFQYNYEVDFPPDLDPSGLLSDRVRTVDLPGLSLETLDDFPSGQANFNIALPTSYKTGGPCTMEFTEYEDDAVNQLVENWIALIVKPDRTFFHPKNYSKIIRVRVYGAGENQLLYTLKLIDCFPLTTYKRNLGYQNNEVMIVDVPFIYNDLEKE